MSAAKHTPWAVAQEWPDEWNAPDYDGEGSVETAAIVDSHGQVVAFAVDRSDFAFGAMSTDDHARLIAAAPELLAVAARAETWIADVMVRELGWPPERVGSPPEGSHLHALRAAIAKATGSAS